MIASPSKSPAARSSRSIFDSLLLLLRRRRLWAKASSPRLFAPARKTGAAQPFARRAIVHKSEGAKLLSRRAVGQAGGLSTARRLQLFGHPTAALAQLFQVNHLGLVGVQQALVGLRQAFKANVQFVLGGCLAGRESSPAMVFPSRESIKCHRLRRGASLHAARPRRDRLTLPLCILLSL